MVFNTVLLSVCLKLQMRIVVLFHGSGALAKHIMKDMQWLRIYGFGLAIMVISKLPKVTLPRRMNDKENQNLKSFLTYVVVILVGGEMQDFDVDLFLIFFIYVSVSLKLLKIEVNDLVKIGQRR